MAKERKPLSLLTGTVVKTEKGFFYVKNGVRVRIPSRRVLRSWNFYRIVKAKEEQMAHLPIAGKLGFRDGTLIYCIADANYYIISGNKLHHVTSPDTLKDHGLRITDAIWVSKDERDLHRRAS